MKRIKDKSSMSQALGKLEHVKRLLEKTLKDKWREEDLRWDTKADLRD